MVNIIKEENFHTQDELSSEWDYIWNDIVEQVESEIDDLFVALYTNSQARKNRDKLERDEDDGM